MDTNEAVEATRNWARQTFLFVLSAKKPSGPVEVMEHLKIRAENLLSRLVAESVIACGEDVSPSRFIPALVTKVLDWVVETHKGK